MQTKQYYVYIITNNYHAILYTGVTNDLVKRVYQHREKMSKGFTSRYEVTKLVYYEIFEDPYNAICREKQIKGGSRADKMKLIENFNPEFRDLYRDIYSV